MKIFDEDGNPVSEDALRGMLAKPAPDPVQITVHMLDADGVAVSQHTFDVPPSVGRVEIIWPDGQISEVRHQS